MKQIRTVIYFVLIIAFMMILTACSSNSDIDKVDSSYESPVETFSVKFPKEFSLENDEFEAQLEGNWKDLWKYVRYLGKKVPECLNPENRDFFIWINDEYEILQGPSGYLYFSSATKKDGICIANACNISSILPYDVPKNRAAIEDYFGSNYRVIEKSNIGDYALQYDFKDYYVQFYFTDQDLLSSEYECIIQMNESEPIDINKLNKYKQYADYQIDRTILNDSKWELIKNELEHLGQPGILYTRTDQDNWIIQPKKGQLSRFYYKNTATQYLAEIDVTHSLWSVCIPNKVLLQMNEDNLSMERVTTYWNVPYEWSLYYPSREDFLWQSEQNFDTLEEWNPFDYSFYVFYFDGFCVRITADKNGNVHAEDYSEIRRYPDIEF